MYIYGLFHPINQELRYIGFTSGSPQIRLRQHLSKSSLSKNTYKNNWIKSLLKLNLSPEIYVLQTTSEKDWKFDESWNIQYFRSIGCNLTNSTDGGEGVINPSSFTRKKMSESAMLYFKNNPNKLPKSMLGKFHSKETRDKMSKTHSNPSDETRKKKSLAKLGIPKSQETRKKMSEFQKHRTLETKIKQSKTQQIFSSIQKDEIREKYTHDGVTIRNLADIYHVNRKTIRRVLNNKHII